MSKRVIAAAVVVLVVAGAAGAYFFFLRPEPGYAGVEALVADLERAGVECKKLQVSPAEQTEQVGAEFGFCYIGKRNVNINVYEDPDRVEDHVAGNVSVRGQNPNYFTSLVAGSNWVVDTYSEKTAREVQQALGGRIE